MLPHYRRFKTSHPSQGRTITGHWTVGARIVDRRSAPARHHAVPSRCRPEERLLVIRSPFKDKDSQEHFEVRTHKR